MKYSRLAAAWLAIEGVAASECLKKLESKALRKEIKLDRLMMHSEKLQELAYETPGRNRVYTSDGFVHTLDYIIAELIEGSGDFYDIEFVPTVFEVPLDPAPLTVGQITYETVPMSTTAGGPYGNFSAAPIGEVSNLGCVADDYPNLTGAIAFIARGECTFEVKSQLAGAAGAVAAVIYNEAGDYELPSGTLGAGEGVVPSTAIYYDNATAILTQLGNRPNITASLDISLIEVESNNLVATSKSGDQDNIYMLGAHADSVAAGPGINDNGSGSVALLELAVQLSKFKLNNAVRFAWWTAEESGLLGSYYYTDNTPAEELAKIRLYMNFDMVASPNYVIGIYDGDGSAFNLSGPAGSGQAEKMFEDYFASEDIPSVPSAFTGRSDYAGFIDAGIPSGGLFSGADGSKTEEEVALFGGTVGIPYDPNYHQVGDTVDNLDRYCFVEMTKAIAHSAAVYGKSWEGFPERDTTGAARKRATFTREQNKRNIRDDGLVQRVASAGCHHSHTEL